MIKAKNFINYFVTTATLLASTNYSLSEKNNIEDMIHREYSSNEENARKNNQYLIDNLSEKERLEMQDLPALKGKLAKFLTEVESIDYEKQRGRIYPVSFVNYSGPYGVFSLNSRQIVRLNLIIESLKNEKFREEIISQRDIDMWDFQTEGGKLPAEGGGRGEFFDKEFFLRYIPSEDVKKEYDEKEAKLSNRRYIPDKEIAGEGSFVLQYHFHATELNNKRYAGPSCNSDKYATLGDVNLAYQIAESEGESYALQITSLSLNSFNVAYYTGAKNKEGKTKVTILDLGNWFVSDDVEVMPRIN